MGQRFWRRFCSNKNIYFLLIGQATMLLPGAHAVPCEALSAEKDVEQNISATDRRNEVQRKDEDSAHNASHDVDCHKSSSLGGGSLAQDTALIAISDIKIHGCGNFDPKIIFSCFPTNPQRRYSKEMLDACLKNLYKVGFFKTVRLEVVNSTLHIHVTENKFIGNVYFDGNGNNQSSDLRKLVENFIRPNQIVSENKIQEARQNIVAFYRAKGKFNTRVRIEIVPRKHSRADLVFFITEGRNAYIRAIQFQGIKHFTEKELRKVIASRVARFWRFWLPGEERYSDDRVHREDVEALEAFYKERGFLKVKVYPYVEIAPDGASSSITFVMEEGPRYTFGDTVVVSQLPHIKTAPLSKKIFWKKGQWFNNKLVQHACKIFDDFLTDSGHPFVQIRPKITTQEEGNTPSVHLELVVESSPPVYADDIVIRGNVRTEEGVIRRLMMFSDGDPVNRYLITRSEEALKGTGFFQSVSIEEAPGGRGPNGKIFSVQVVEDTKVQVMLTGGAATDAGLFVRGNCSQDNFMGKGWRGEIMGDAGTRGWSANTGLTVPNFLHRPIVASVRANIEQYTGFTKEAKNIISETFDGKKNKKNGEYGQRSMGVAFSARYNLGKGFSQGWGYEINRSFLRFHGAKNISPFLVENVEKEPLVWASGISHSVTYNHPRYDQGLLRSGWFGQITNKFVGLGGNTHYFFNSAKIGAFYGFGKNADYLLRFDMGAGILNPQGYVRFNNLTFLGDYTFPGFEMCGIGPRDTKTKDALGGKKYYTASVKFYVPLKLPIATLQDSPIRLVTFLQSGSLWDSIFVGKNIGSNDFGNRISAGGGVVWKAPIMGGLNVGLLVSTALKKDSNDLTKKILFILGTEF